MRELFACLFLLWAVSPVQADSFIERNIDATVKISGGTQRCSGVHIGEGRIITAAHCYPPGMVNPENVRRTVGIGDREYVGELQVYALMKDLAVLSINAVPEGLNAVDIRCHRPPQRFEQVVNIGGPLGHHGSFTRGEVTQTAILGFRIDNHPIYSGKQSPPLFFTNAPAARGMSGGGTFDATGRLIGIIAISLGAGLSGSIQTAEICNLLDQNGIDASSTSPS